MTPQEGGRQAQGGGHDVTITHSFLVNFGKGHGYLAPKRPEMLLMCLKSERDRGHGAPKTHYLSLRDKALHNVKSEGDKTCYAM